MAQTRNIKYINREFDDFRDQLVEFSKSYFPDTYMTSHLLHLV